MDGQVGLVLEGGGMRGVYTSGVLDVLLEQGIHVPYCIGVSAGACNLTSYLSGQIGRSYHVNVDYADDPDYISWGNLLHEHSMINMDMLFHKMPQSLIPFDFAAFAANPTKMVVGTTDCVTGKAVYFEEQDISGQDGTKHLQASSSLPLACLPVEVDGMTLMDGGISDPIPLAKAFSDGCTKAIVVLTRPQGYVKEPSKTYPLIKLKYGKEYKGMVEAMKHRHTVYNQQVQEIERLAKEHTVLVLRPSVDLQLDLLSREPEKLRQLYRLGINDTQSKLADIRDFIGAAS